jgi:hypothetical protein
VPPTLSVAEPAADPAAPEAAYAPDSVFDAAADTTPTPPHGFRMPVHPENEHDNQPGGSTS